MRITFDLDKTSNSWDVRTEGSSIAVPLETLVTSMPDSVKVEIRRGLRTELKTEKARMDTLNTAIATAQTQKTECKTEIDRIQALIDSLSALPEP